MAAIVFKLNGVSDDEADQVRALLDDNSIEYYETSSGRWGVSVAALWVKNDDDKPQARILIEEFQVRRQAEVRAEYEQLRLQGELDNVLSRLLRNPVQSIVYIFFVLLIIYLSLSPFLYIGK